MKALFILITLLVSMVSMAFVTSDRTIATRADGANSVSDVINDHVNSLPNTAPTITLTGSSSVSYTVDATYSELGATCSDAEDGAITVPAPSFSPALDMSTAATYTVTYTCTDSSGSTDTVSRTVVVSAGGTGPTSTPNLFADGFEDATMENNSVRSSALNTINFRWENNNATSVVTMNPNPTAVWNNGVISNPAPDPNSDWTAKAGDYSLRASYAAGGDTAEQRFNFDARTELWLRYWVRVPENYTHGTGGGSAVNNKFLAIWNDDYSQAGIGSTFWLSMESAGGGDTNLAFTYTVGGNTASVAMQQHTAFIDASVDRARWMQIVVHLKAESSSDANDGVVQTWRRWENESSFTAFHDSSTVPFRVATGGFAAGYFMGWANGKYAERTEFLIDDVEFSDGSLL